MGGDAAALLLAVAQRFALRALAADTRAAQRLGVRLAAGLTFQAAEPEIPAASYARRTIEVEATVAAAAAGNNQQLRFIDSVGVAAGGHVGHRYEGGRGGARAERRQF